MSKKSLYYIIEDNKLHNSFETECIVALLLMSININTMCNDHLQI